MENPKDGWVPVVGTKRLSCSFKGHGNPILGETGEVHTLFIDNLPEFTSQAWLRKFFTKFGVVKDVFIPQKRSKVTGRKFGFIRYDCAVSADLAISKSNGIWLGDRKLFVKFASFNQNVKDKYSKSYMDSRETVALVVNKGRECPSFPRVESGFRGEEVGGKLSFAQVLKGSSKDGMSSGVKSDILKLDPSGNDWLDRSMVAKLHKFMEVDDIIRDFEKENINGTLIRSMGGRYILITFVTTEARDAIIKDSCLHRWFCETKPWQGEVAMS